MVGSKIALIACRLVHQKHQRQRSRHECSASGVEAPTRANEGEAPPWAIFRLVVAKNGSPRYQFASSCVRRIATIVRVPTSVQRQRQRCGLALSPSGTASLRR